MPTLVFLPHSELCPAGATISTVPGETILDAALRHGIAIEHACEKCCACTTCHVIVRQGFESLAPGEEREEDLLDKAWGLEPESRLSCQVRVQQADLLVEIPRYSVNYVREGH